MAKYDIYIRRQPEGRITIYTLALIVRLKIMNGLGILGRMSKIIAEKHVGVSSLPELGLQTALKNLTVWSLFRASNKVGIETQSVRVKKQAKLKIDNETGLLADKLNLRYRQYLTPQNETGISLGVSDIKKTAKTTVADLISLLADIDGLNMEKFIAAGEALAVIDRIGRIISKMHTAPIGMNAVGWSNAVSGSALRRKRLFEETEEFWIGNDSAATLPELFYVTLES